MNLRNNIPNMLTCCNLLCGGLGIIAVMNEGAPALWFVCVGCVFDFLDGSAARCLKTNSPIGKDLDSLADVVTFGMLPSLVMYKLLDENNAGITWLPYLSLSLLVFSALRLAVFNTDEEQQTLFKGLPTPANALFITSLYLLPEWFPIYNHTVLAAITILFSYFLVSPIRLISLKFKSYSWKENKVRFTFLGITVLLLCTLGFGALPWIIPVYLFTPVLKQN